MSGHALRRLSSAFSLSKVSRKCLHVVPQTCKTFDEEGLEIKYREPPRDMKQIVDTPHPYILLPSQRSVWDASLVSASLFHLIDLTAQEKLAGVMFNADSNHNDRREYYTSVYIFKRSSGVQYVCDEKDRVKNIPLDARIRDLKWSTNGQHLSFTVQTQGNDGRLSMLQLWVIDSRTRQARSLLNQHKMFLNLILLDREEPDKYQSYYWVDRRKLLVPVIPQRGKRPQRPNTPCGPKIQSNEKGNRISHATYQHLLEDDYDADLFEYYARSQITLVSLDGTVKFIGPPRAYWFFLLETCLKEVVVTWLVTPFMLHYPLHYFNLNSENWNLDGKCKRQDYSLPRDDVLEEVISPVPLSFRHTVEGFISRDRFLYPYPLTSCRWLYYRIHGVRGKARMFLPPTYKKDRDGPLPCLYLPYDELCDRFEDDVLYFAPDSPLLFLTRGFVVLAEIEDDSLPRRRSFKGFVNELVLTAKAAVQAAISEGVVDGNRVAVAGHSFGGNLTALLLIHAPTTFCCGIALSGAYNRSLTPFGYQDESKVMWEDMVTYIKMSPFFMADKLKRPILLIHGEEDGNPGTWPMQSIRFYQALRCNGACCRLVILPREDHEYKARESILHVLWEIDQWLDKYCVRTSHKQTANM